MDEKRASERPQTSHESTGEMEEGHGHKGEIIQTL